MIDLSKCADCGADNPQMYNCNKHGEPLPGFVCYPCWRDKHPVFNKHGEIKTNPALFLWAIFIVVFLVFAIYKIYNMAGLL